MKTVIEILSNKRFILNDEKKLQAQIEKMFAGEGLVFKREFILDGANTIDFLIEGTGVEVKIKGSAKSIYRQCERYSLFEEIKELILITNRAMGFPKELNGKPCYVFNIGRAWL